MSLLDEIRETDRLLKEGTKKLKSLYGMNKKSDTEREIFMVTAKEARQALKTIAQYCDEVDCYECEIQDACEGIEAQLLPFCRLIEIINKKEKENSKLARAMASQIMNRKD